MRSRTTPTITLRYSPAPWTRSCQHHGRNQRRSLLLYAARPTLSRFKDDVVDVIISQRSRRNDRLQEELNAGAPIDDSLFPPALTRRYTLNFKPVTPSGSATEKNRKHLSVRQDR